MIMVSCAVEEQHGEVRGASGGELTGPGGTGGNDSVALEVGRAEDQPASGRRCL